ncbi:MAG: hypothetical protein Kow00111_22180 [Thermincola ferriacetica]
MVGGVRMQIGLSHKNLSRLLMVLALMFYIANTFPLLGKMPVTMDEVLFAEPARNFVQEGHFGTTSMSGLFQFQTKTYWQHPLYIMLMYIPIKSFGFNCWSIKILSAFLGLLSLLLAYKIGKNLGVPHLFPILLVFNVLFIWVACIGRMEMLTLLLSLASFYFAWNKRPVEAGFIGSLAVLNHPVGFFTVLDGLILLKLKASVDKRFFAALAFPVLITFSFVIGDLNEFVRQYFTVQRYLYANSGWLGGPLVQLKNFLRLLQEARQWLFWLIPLALMMIVGLTKKQDNEAKTLLLIQAVNFLGLVVLVPNKYINYYVALVIPYMALYAAYSLKKHRSTGLVFLLIVLIFTNGIGIVKSFSGYRNGNDGAATLQNLVEPHSTVIAQPSLAVYLDDCRVIGFHNVRMIMDLERKTAETALQEISPDYIVIDTNIAQFNKWPLFTEDQDSLGKFIKKKTVFCGKTQIHGKNYYVFKFTRDGQV